MSILSIAHKNIKVTTMKTNNDYDINNVPIWHKITLSFKEAALLTGIGECRLRLLAEKNPELIIHIDSKTRIKRDKLEKFIANHSFI
jgi:hypothetical protein